MKAFPDAESLLLIARSGSGTYGMTLRDAANTSQDASPPKPYPYAPPTPSAGRTIVLRTSHPLP